MKKLAHPTPLSFSMLALCLALGSGCGLLGTSLDRSDATDSGVITLARPLPTQSVVQSSMLAFASTTSSEVNTKNTPLTPSTEDAQVEGAQLLIQKADQTLTLQIDGEAVIIIEEVSGLDSLKEGTIYAAHKQEEALWYAPDSYFEKRGLPVPTDYDASRFLRGALGTKVVYLDSETPIHDSAVYSEDVGGIRLSTEQIELLYEHMDVGSAIEVR